MKALHFLLLVPVAVTASAPSFAQNPNGPLSRVEVLQHLYDLEGVGYRPAQASNLRFPYDIEAADARLAAKKDELARRESVQHSPQSAVESPDRH